ncbi:hypothetical protein FACS1894102_7150 [Spirochaetia bacterium]|nr:hypothetical protein FACS1894102_7150 [Spirochaetia bacterium]
MVYSSCTSQTLSNGRWNKLVTNDDGSKTGTNPNGWNKYVVNGNTTTITGSFDGEPSKDVIVVNGNTTTATHINGSWQKTVDEGGTKTTTFSNGRWTKRIVTRHGNNIFITQSSGTK